MNFLSTDFKYLADQIINHHIMVVGQQLFQIVELEYYYKSLSHPDGFVHGDNEQLQNGTWYYHRMRGSYKEGTYKGMDITFGPNDQYGGLLVRTIKDLKTNKIIEGPCLVVQAILSEHNLTSLKQLADLSDQNTRDVLTNIYHYLKPLHQSNGLSLEYSPRVGLKFNSKMSNDDFQNRFQYILKAYRVNDSSCSLKKQSITIGIKNKSKNTKIDSEQQDASKITPEQLNKFEMMVIKNSLNKSVKWNKDFYYQLYQFCLLKNSNWIS